MGIVEGPIAGGRVGGGQRLRRGAGVRFPRGDLENSKSNALLDELNALPKELGNGLRLLRTQRGARFEIAGAHVREQTAPLAWGKRGNPALPSSRYLFTSRSQTGLARPSVLSTTWMSLLLSTSLSTILLSKPQPKLPSSRNPFEHYSISSPLPLPG